MVAVVCDFGYSRTVDTEAGSSTTKSDVGPVKWYVDLIEMLCRLIALLRMSIESLLYRQYSSKSDVWSYGMGD